MHWTSAPRFIADIIAYQMLNVPDHWRPLLSNMLTVMFWADLFLTIALLTLVAYGS